MKKVLNCISIIMFFAVTAMIGVSTVFFQHGKPFKKALEQHGNVRQAAEDYAVSNFPFKANWESLCARLSLRACGSSAAFITIKSAICWWTFFQITISRGGIKT